MTYAAPGDIEHLDSGWGVGAERQFHLRCSAPALLHVLAPWMRRFCDRGFLAAGMVAGARYVPVQVELRAGNRVVVGLNRARLAA